MNNRPDNFGVVGMYIENCENSRFSNINISDADTGIVQIHNKGLTWDGVNINLQNSLLSSWKDIKLKHKIPSTISERDFIEFIETIKDRVKKDDLEVIRSEITETPFWVKLAHFKLATITLLSELATIYSAFFGR